MRQDNYALFDLYPETRLETPPETKNGNKTLNFKCSTMYVGQPTDFDGIVFL